MAVLSYNSLATPHLYPSSVMNT